MRDSSPSQVVIPMNVWLEFLVLDSHIHCLHNCLFQLDRWCFVSHGNWMKQKKISVIWLQSADMTHIISESERGLPYYYHISTSTYQFRCSPFSQYSSAQQINDFCPNKAQLTSLQSRLLIVIVWRTMRSLIDEHIFTLLISSSLPHTGISHSGNLIKIRSTMFYALYYILLNLLVWPPYIST